MPRVVSAKHFWLALSAVLLIALCIYWPGLAGSFMFDDKPNIVNDATLRLFDGGLSSLITASSSNVSGPLGRPLSAASFALNFYFFGDQPFSFKLVNLLIHLANGLLVFLLVRHLWPRLTNTTDEARSSMAALWITAVWLLHPINLTPVLFVVQRMTSLSAFFTLAALCLYLYGRQVQGVKRWRAIAAGLLLCWPAAIFSKESGVLLPLFIVTCEWLAFRSFDAIPRKMKWLGLAMVSLFTTTLLILKWDYLTGGYVTRDFGLLERLMTEARILWLYAVQIILPWIDLFSLHHDDIVISHSLLSPPQTLFAIVVGAFLLGAAIMRHKQSPMFAFAVIWFIVAHALESTIVPLELVFEHRNYLASLGILMWLASLLIPSLASQKNVKPRLVLAMCFVLYCGFATSLRSMQWSDEFHRTQTDATTHPQSARANYEAGVIILERATNIRTGNIPAYQRARYHFERAADLDQRSKDAVMGVLYLDCMANAPKDLVAQAQLRQRFAKTRLSIQDRVVIHSLSGILIEKRLCMDDDEVMALINAALSNPTANGALKGMIYAVAMDYAAAKLHALPLALKYARAALDSDPQNVAFRINLIHLLLASGDMVGSRQEYNLLLKMAIALPDKASFDQITQKIMHMESNANKS